MSTPNAPRPYPSQDPLCALCNHEVPTMDAIIYHGVVYHPACVAPTTKRDPSVSMPYPLDPDARGNW